MATGNLVLWRNIFTRQESNHRSIPLSIP